MTEPTKKQSAWLRPKCNKNEMRAGLYLVPTPIGNLADITLRALDCLSAVDLVVCEDTRMTKKLLTYYGLSKKLMVYNDHSTEAQRDKVIRAIKEGQSVALVSDAGTPLISDPGYKLVRAIMFEELYMTALPGANAVLPALQLSGMPSDKFVFLGFLPTKKGQRQETLKEWGAATLPVIYYESPSRLLSTLDMIADLFENREVAVVREISKMFEEYKSGRAQDLLAYYEEQGAPKGEIVLVIAPDDQVFADEDIKVLLLEALKGQRTKEAAQDVANQTGRSKKEIYEMALTLQKES